MSKKDLGNVSNPNTSGYGFSAEQEEKKGKNRRKPEENVRKHRVQAVLTKQDLDDIKALASFQDVSVSTLINDLCKKAIQENQEDIQFQKDYERRKNKNK
ncbi:hypothetical protein DDJ69_31050 [Klebsiella oxytoca]|nr:hypothetical protein DDJ69_31050 [Klebsiella oxytoca]